MKICPQCFDQGTLLEKPLSGEALLYSYSVVHVAPDQFKPPYAVGYVDFPHDVRVFGRIEVDDFAQLTIGMRLRLAVGPVRYAPTGEAVKGYVFAPVSAVGRGD